MKRLFPCTIKRFVVAGSCVSILTSCAMFRNDEKYYEKQEARLARQEQQDYEQKLNEHKKMQSKQTLKMMKEAEREAKKLNKRRKR